MYKTVDKEGIDYLLNLKGSDITLEILSSLFNEVDGVPPKFDTDQVMTIPLSRFDKNDKGVVTTTVGSYIYNMFISEVFGDIGFYKVNGYVNNILDEDAIYKIDNNMATAFLNDVISFDDNMKYINARDWLAYNIVILLASPMTSDMTKNDPEIEKRKKELFDKYSEEIKTRPVETVDMIETELINMAKKKFKDNPTMDIYESGARGSFKNNYKVTNIMRGIIIDPEDKNKFFISKKSLSQGIPKDEIHEHANLMVAGSFGRAKDTAIGGYLAKLYAGAFQSTVLGEKKSDCGSKAYMDVMISEIDIKQNKYTYRYIMENNKLVRLDPDIIHKYLNKTVKMRSPLYCRNESYCNVCSGDLYYKLGIVNIGLIFVKPANVIMLKSMKSFHDLSVNVTDVNINDFVD